MAVISKFTPMFVTDKGLRLKSKVEAGITSLNLIKAVIGEGYLQEGQDISGIENLVLEIPSHQNGIESDTATVDFERKYVASDGITNIGIRVVNGNAAFVLREIGIIAKDPDEGEILYAYVNFGDNANPIMAFNGVAHIYRHFTFPIIIKNTNNLQVNITFIAEVTRKEFEEELNKRFTKRIVPVLPSNSLKYDFEDGKTLFTVPSIGDTVKGTSTIMADSENGGNYQVICSTGASGASTTIGSSSNVYSQIAFSGINSEGAKTMNIEFDMEYVNNGRMRIALADLDALSTMNNADIRNNTDGIAIDLFSTSSNRFQVNNTGSTRASFFGVWLHCKFIIDFAGKQVQYIITNKNDSSDEISGTAAFRGVCDKVTGIAAYTWLANDTVYFDNINVTVSNDIDENIIYMIPKGDTYDSYIYIDKVPVKIGDGNIDSIIDALATPPFSQADARANIESGDKLPVLFGKIKKWFADLKVVAFSNDYNDLDNKPTSMKNPSSLTLNLNGSSASYNGASSLSRTWYSPTSAGTAGYIPVSNGSSAPVWKIPDNYGECTTLGETTTKLVSIPNFKLVKGVRVRVKFTYPHKSLCNYAQLNVNSTGAKTIKYYGKEVLGYEGVPLKSSAKTGIVINTWEAGEIVEFEYDGTYWSSIPSQHVLDPSDIRIAHTDYLSWNSDGVTCYMGKCFNNIASSADYIIGDNIDDALEDAASRVLGGGKIRLITGATNIMFNINRRIVIGRYTTWTKSGLRGANRFTLEGNIRGYRDFSLPRLRFYSGGYLDGTECSAANGMTLTIKNIDFQIWTTTGTLINLGRDNGSTLILENVLIHVGDGFSYNFPEKLFIADNIILKDCDFTLETSNSRNDYPCSSGLECKNIQVCGGTITLINNSASAFQNQEYELNFLYNTEAKGYIEKCKISCSGDYRTNISNGEIIFDKCEVTLNNSKASLCHYTSDVERKGSILRDCIVNYTASTYLTFGKITGCTFNNSSTGYTTDTYKLQILCPTQMTNNTFVGRSEMNFNGNKVLFADNILQYAQSYTTFPTGSINANNMVSG